MRLDRGVRSLPATRTRCLGVDGVEAAKTSLKRGADGVENIGGRFSFVSSSAFGVDSILFGCFAALF